jgi:hypothetical protein
MSRNQATKQFWGAISTAINWAKREDETDSVEPGQMGRAQAKGDFGRTCRLAVTPHQGSDFTLRGASGRIVPSAALTWITVR